ncbi:hypothetical protein N7517_004734 [Penicillium concentricum]|uniref:Uncharacterized protein n=1 Tax=Penicillium concentricum TaxID=293559 RepID=A0A9W9V8F4_9EURO|nr:uncharacterized protein N7517_004734 [Penicillium concentricum]KAJ5372728.1 hypothetical protein N7517_004734 [Penicillium concentricum]
MAHNHRIQAPSNEGSEELALLRFRVIRRHQECTRIQRELQEIIRWYDFIASNSYMFSSMHLTLVDEFLGPRLAGFIQQILHLLNGEDLDVNMLGLWEW